MKRLVVALCLVGIAGCSGSGQGAPSSGEALPAAVEIAPETLQQIQAELQRAGGLFHRAQFDEGLKIAAGAIALAPERAESFETVSNWYTQLSRHDLAVTAFERLALDSSHGLRFMARHQALSGNRDAGLATLDRCIGGSSRNEGCRSERAALRQTTGNFEGALEDAKIAYELIPAQRSAARLVELQRVNGHYDEALTTVQAALERYGQNQDGAPRAGSQELWIAFARLQLHERNDVEAEPALRRALDVDPRSHTALRLLAGIVLRRGGDVEGAYLLQRADLFRDYADTTRSLKNQLALTQDPMAALMLTELELSIGDFDAAQRWVKLARPAGVPAERLAAAKGWIGYALGDIEAGDRALARFGNAPDGHLALARAARSVRTGDEAKAFELLGHAVKFGPNERCFLRRAADLHVALGDQEGADALLARASTAGFP